MPSEAEWEYACRAGTTTRFYWGDDPTYSEIGGYAWYWSNCSGESYAHAVGRKAPNAFGLCDMGGNAWEWVQDWWALFPGEAAVTDPAGPATGSDRVTRGAGWCNGPNFCRSASRAAYPPTDTTDHFGFRVAR